MKSEAVKRKRSLFCTLSPRQRVQTRPRGDSSSLTACKALTGPEQSHSSLSSPQLDQCITPAAHVLLPTPTERALRTPSLGSAPWTMTLASGISQSSPRSPPHQEKGPSVVLKDIFPTRGCPLPWSPCEGWDLVPNATAAPHKCVSGWGDLPV